MNYLTIADLVQACEDLFGARRAELEASETGKLYGPLIEGRLTALRELPDDEESSPFGKKLREADRLHDDYGRAIYYLAEAVLRHPGLSGAQREAARSAREDFIPSLSELKNSYAIEAAKAKGRREKLEATAESLRKIPVPSASDEGETLYEWVLAFIEQGELIDELLEQRGAKDASPRDAREAFAERSLTLGLLSRFRSVLSDEIAENKDLPRDLEERVFGKFDELNAARAPKKET